MHMLQQPHEATHSTGAIGLIRNYCEAAEVTAEGMLADKADMLDRLSTLLTCDDTIEHRSDYARLLGYLCAHSDEAGVQRIGSVGAVPYVLQLLKKADNDDTKAAFVESLHVSEPIASVPKHCTNVFVCLSISLPVIPCYSAVLS